MGDERIVCKEHTQMRVDLSELKTELKNFRELITKHLESVDEEVDRLRKKSGEHYGATQKLELAITEINVTLKQYKETMDKLDGTLKEQGKDNKDISIKTAQIYDILRQASKSAKSSDDKVAMKFMDTMKDLFTTSKVIIILLTALIAAMLGLKWDDIVKIIIGA